MADDAKPPISPTVAAVFDTFVAKLQADKVGVAVADGLKQALSTQNFDAESLRKAMFGTADQDD